MFMQDGAPAHTAHLIRDRFEFVSNDYIKDWPGNSPDLNPIENLWSIIKTKLHERDCSTVPLLTDAIQDIWNNFDPQILRNLAASLPKRLRECIKQKGYPTKY